MDDKEADPAKIICRTRVGDQWDHSVSQVFPDTDLASETLLHNDDIELSWEDSVFTASPDASNFETEDDGTEAWAHCTVDLILSEKNYEIVGTLFDRVYEVTYGVRVFDANDENPVDIASAFFDIYLPSPDYDDSWNDEPEEALAEAFFPIDTSSLTSDGSDRDAFIAFNVAFNVTAVYEEPDVLDIALATDAPAELFPQGAALVLWAQFRLSSDAYGDYTKVSCNIEVDGAAGSEVIDTYYGPTEFKDADVESTKLADIQTDEFVDASYSDAY
jgi:hypothetical protein